MATSLTRSFRSVPAALGISGLALALGLSACGKENDDKPSAHNDSHSDSHTAETSEAALAGAAWLENELSDGVLVNEQYASDDYGTTVELAYALRAVEPESEALTEVAGALEAGAEAYTSPGNDVYAGATGKLASFATDAGHDPRAFGGLDLIGQLEERTADDGPTIGRISDQGAQDYSNAFSQIWTVRALTLAESNEAPAARDYLLSQQCDAGFIRLYFPEPNAEQTCGEAPDEPIDTTALAYILLHDLAEDDAELAAALDEGIAYILSQQADDGSFSGGGSGSETPNANSTGLAGWALQLAGEDEAAASAGAWVRAHQIDDCAGPLADSNGAIGFDDAAVKSAGSKGITAKTEYQWRLTTVQALPALLALPEGASAAPCPTS